MSPDLLCQCLPRATGLKEVASADEAFLKQAFEDAQALCELKALPNIPVSGEFPAPPFPAPEGSIAIVSRAMLLDESRRQDNCLADYDSKIRLGAVVIFRMLAPERASFELVRHASSWRLGQVKRSGNADVRTETIQMLQNWLKRSLRRGYAKRPVAAGRSAGAKSKRSGVEQMTFTFD